MRKTQTLTIDRKKIAPKLISIIKDIKKKLDQLESEVVVLEQTQKEAK